MNIPLFDLGNKKIQKEVFAQLKNLVKKEDFILGREVTLFEKDFAKYLGSSFCIGVASGTDALLLSLRAAGIGEGDEVIIPAFSFIATASSIILSGARPVFVDIEKNKPTIDVSLIESAITKNTKAIIPVHLYGIACNMGEILKIAKKHRLTVIEDACQSHGGMYKGKKLGTLGDFGAFSFYPTKNLGAWGDGGAIVVKTAKHARLLGALRDHGQEKKNSSIFLGLNSRLDSIQAMVLRIKLKHLNQEIKKKHEIAQEFSSQLKNLPLILPTEGKKCEQSHHLYVIQTKKRNALFNYLKKKGIQCGIHYPIPLHLQPALKNLGYKKGDFKNAEEISSTCLSLPLSSSLTKAQVQYIRDTIQAFFKKN